jgi:hypothetical protein
MSADSLLPPTYNQDRKAVGQTPELFLGFSPVICVRPSHALPKRQPRRPSSSSRNPLRIPFVAPQIQLKRNKGGNKTVEPEGGKKWPESASHLYLRHICSILTISPGSSHGVLSEHLHESLPTNPAAQPEKARQKVIDANKKETSHLPPPQIFSIVTYTSAAAAMASFLSAMGTVPAWPCAPCTVTVNRV